jgi:hypothetical protein
VSEFRIFCIAAFVGAGLFAASANHGLTYPELRHNPVAMIACALFFGFAAVALFGRRAA